MSLVNIHDQKLPKLSILIPVYNVADYLVDCLTSLLKQVDHQVEIIALDDASSDGCTKILQDLQKHYPQLQVIYQKQNFGVSAARNNLKKYAKGEYIWFIDSDDIVREGAYEVILQAIDEFYGVDVIIGDYYLWEPAKQNALRLEKTFLGRTNVKLDNIENSFLFNLNKLRKNYIWCHIYNRHLLDKVEFPSRARFEDIFFITDISILCNSYVYISHPLVNYRSRPNSSTTSKKSCSYINDYLSAFLYRSQKLKSNIQMEPSKKAYMYYKIYNNYVGTLKNIGQDATLTLDEKSELIRYIDQNFKVEFDHIYEQCFKTVDIFRRLLLRKKQKNSQKYYLQYLLMDISAAS
ncbi:MULTISPECIES: glycosyltransferase family 2 protein [Acinetobacter]|uniref:glycosyltransferase family 2 protein n=1 Tax=Acinetobacter TaxID=469 RepID=UPI0014402F69|nr:glycosyltransferase family 2 protein [Acinetobacter indicus]QIZ62604.1 glycosyltransferase family 2 protein [Acinetobacter indicus]